MLPFNSLGSVLDRMTTLSQVMDEALVPESAPARNGGRTRYLWVPVDLYETAAAYVVEADVAGVDPKDIDVSFERNALVIRGTRAPAARPADPQLRVYGAERPSGDFTRVIRLPESVDGEQIKASHTHGVLKITVPKAAATRARKITVNGGAELKQNSN